VSDKTIAVLSGKGGTGKTFIAVNLACVAAPATYIDCDAEEPNGHLFFKPAIKTQVVVNVPVPRVDPAKCIECRLCVDFCAFHALAWTGGELLVFDEICHGCGGCVMLCRARALREIERAIGRVQTGEAQGVRVLSGFLNPGEATGVPVIKQLLNTGHPDGRLIIDCPPGSSCMVSESVRDADYCVLVAEPTRFGAHNLGMVHELVRLYNKPCGVVLNKALPGDDPSRQYCQTHGLPILAEIAFETRLGQLTSDGLIAVKEDSRYLELFECLLERIDQEACRAAVSHP
jgi:MinD superfamily P-loop ATPase